MTDANGRNNQEDIRDLRLPYLEGLLTPEEESRVEEFMVADKGFAAEIEELRQWTDALEENKELFCPDPWEIFDLARGQEDSSGDLTSHVEHCGSCRQAAEAFRSQTGKKRMPQELWDEMTRHDIRSTWLRAVSYVREMTARLTEKTSEFFRMPAMALGAVAAAVLVAVLMWPAGAPLPLVALSSETWELSPLEKGIMGQVESATVEGADSRARVAVIVLFKDSSRPMKPSAIDSLYEELKPSLAIRKRYRFVTPAEFREAVLGKKVPVEKRKELLRGLHTALGVSKAVMVTVTEDKNRFSIVSELVDTNTGKSIREMEARGVSASEISRKVGDIGLSVLSPE